MYNNRIGRTASNLDLQSPIHRADIEFDKRVRFVEFVCDVWNEGRFGTDLANPVTVNWSDPMELEPASFLDFYESAQNAPNCLHSAISPSFALKCSLGRARLEAAEAAFRRAKQIGLLATNAITDNVPANIAPNEGRGSPRLLERQRCVVIQPAAPPQER